MPQHSRKFSAMSFDRDMRACKTMLRGGSRSFYAASFFLPKNVREPAMALYAFCRLADDAVDEAGADCAAAIAMLKLRVDAIYGGDPWDHPADRAFAHVIRAKALPRASIDALIEGFIWDATSRQYETFEDVLDYAARVAGCVGIMMTLVMEKRAPHILARAADLGVAMQLTNIARDVGEDAQNGRLYLPRQWLWEAGIDPDDFLANPRFTPALGNVVVRLLDEAEWLYARADAGIGLLPAQCRMGIRAARTLYAAIGHHVMESEGDSITTRAYVPFHKKLPLLAKATLPVEHHSKLAALPPLTATQFLLKAVAEQPAPRKIAAPLAFWDLSGRFQNALRVIEKLEHADRAVGKGQIA